MSTTQPCPDCKTYEKRHENYCRMCGRRVSGSCNYVRLANAPTNNEKFCGYCGKEWEECRC